MKIAPGSLVRRSGPFINYVYRQCDVDPRQHPSLHAANSPLLLTGAVSAEWGLKDVAIVLYRSTCPSACACLVMIPNVGPAWVPIRNLTICVE